ncbi:EamA family transporter RarD [Roseibium polysiphoniae]|uniref:EamA family transporter RarD n=1 Tax=Roseibium polysiphoniae TaxID=2571221 RepID=A0A944CAT6_9HYPH|nr:EamA family transporter RarD [Roseibium polysiphoniae]MBS8259107.1 EamA family transporter RarD [Roseibium polysiphoniae]
MSKAPGPATRPNGPAASGDQAEIKVGLAYAFGAYGLWGFLPAYYKLTDTVSADFIVAHRIVWAVLLVGLFLVIMRRFDEVLEIWRTPKLVGLLSISATLVSLNWLVFVWAIGQEKVLDISLGYFINPLVSILLGLVVLREKLTRLQGVAVGLATLAVATKAVLAGGLPWVSLFLAFSFAGYGYLRKIIPVRATPGLFIETSLLSPIALGYLLLNLSWGADAFVLEKPWVLVALIGSGAVTAVPLVMFSAGARRLPLVLVGLLQYIAPSLHFIMAVFVWGEPLDQTTLMTFVIIWVALAVFSFDSLRRWNRERERAVTTPA